MTTTAERYALQKRNQATMEQVNRLLTNEAETVFAIADNMAQQEAGGFLRATVPGLIDKYGQVNAVAAMKYYDEQRALWLQDVNRAPTFSASRNRRIRQGQNRQAERFASAKLRAELYTATLPTFDPLAKSESIIGYGMQMLTSGITAVAPELSNALTRAVGSYNRDTLLYNSALDPNVVGVQRVAEPNACKFCQMVAFGSKGSRYKPRVTSYAVEWHNNCHCSIETLYAGDKPFRPDHYNNFEYGMTGLEKTTEQAAADWEQFKQQYPQKFVSK